MSKLTVNQLILKLHQDLSDLAEQARDADLSDRGRKKLNAEIARAADALNQLLAELDPIKRPREVFDPGNPRTIGFFLALALVAQQRIPLGALEPTYGSGVYALYYNGAYPLYAPLRGSETPIYIGQAVSGNEDARTPVQTSCGAAQ